MSFLRRSFLWLISIAACSPVLIANERADLTLRARSVLRHHCWRCHNGEGSEGGDFDVMKVTDLTDGTHIQPGKPDESYLLERILKDQMPPKDIRERVSAAEGEIIRKWIASGAVEFPEAVGRSFLSLETVLSAIRDYLRNVERDDRPYLRFFTLHHLYNNPRILDEDLPTYRAALSKAVNSLSGKPRIVLPRAIDQAGGVPENQRGFLHETVFVIDVRDFDWDRTGAWKAMLRAYPYGLKYSDLRNDNLRRLDEDISELTGNSLSMLRADWFVATATRAPLYYEILDIPHSAKQLESSLKVDIAANFLDPTPERIARAAFAKSGVSGQNRLVERHDASHGMYWKSYDFKPGRARGKLVRFPLGPLNLFPADRHPYPFQAFVHDGGEIIYSLPNGLQAYMLIDGEDRRIDEGPIEVVSDALKTSGIPTIVNGISCMSCHRHGMIPFRDTLRERSAVFGDAEKHVRKLYPEPDRMNQLLATDEQRFMQALKLSIGPFLQRGADKDKPIEDFIEPCGEVARLHRLVYLDLKTIACELDLEDPQDLLIKVGERKLKQLGLESLLKEGGVISRLEWEATDGVSLMQELARELHYTPRLTF
ncbi:MAG: hypothetical protein KDA68_07080 [Planctomycetaceae bacterium]|nr:hypothetical protein [Planctomycetaceae bacterium]